MIDEITEAKENAEQIMELKTQELRDKHGMSHVRATAIDASTIALLVTVMYFVLPRYSWNAFSWIASLVCLYLITLSIAAIYHRYTGGSE